MSEETDTTGGWSTEDAPPPEEPSEQVPAAFVPEAADLAAAAVSDQIAEFKTTVALPGGERECTFRFRPLRSTREYGKAWQRGDALAKKGSWEIDGEQVRMRRADLHSVTLIHACLVEPALTEDQLITISHRNAPLFFWLVDHATEISGMRDTAALEAAKKDLEEV